jgi:hypothetical protein
VPDPSYREDDVGEERIKLHVVLDYHLFNCAVVIGCNVTGRDVVCSEILSNCDRTYLRSDVCTAVRGKVRGECRPSEADVVHREVSPQS